jgi:hypothetical protein
MTTTLNDVALADPFEISIESIVLGITKRSANGTVLTDYVSATLQRKVLMSWRTITSGERDTIVAQCEAAIGTGRVLALPDSRNLTVIFPADSSVVETEFRIPSGWVYNVQATFLETA